MRRTIISWDEQTHEAMRILAIKRKTTMTELVRQAVAAFLEKEKQQEEPLARKEKARGQRRRG